TPASSSNKNNGGGCRAPLNPEMLRRVVPPAQYKAWDARQCHDAIRAAFAQPASVAGAPTMATVEIGGGGGAADDLRTCPKCRFYCVLMDADAVARNRNLLSCLHADCGFRSCIRCQQAYHAGAATCQTSPEQ